MNDKVTLDRQVVEDLLDYFGEPCWYDHHGYCQAHALQEKEDCFYIKLAQALEQPQANPEQELW